jgi:hypothetical protein
MTWLPFDPFVDRNNDSRVHERSPHMPVFAYDEVMSRRQSIDLDQYSRRQNGLTINASSDCPAQLGSVLLTAVTLMKGAPNDVLNGCGFA